MINKELLAEKYNIGIETLTDIIAELQRPWLDPRDEIEAPVFKSNASDIKDIVVGQIVEGVIRNVVDFGAFVDIGLHNDGFIHKSQIGNFFVTHPADHLHVGQQIRARVMEIDYDKEKISLSMKIEGETPRPRPTTPSQSPIEKTPPRMSEESTLKSNISRW